MSKQTEEALGAIKNGQRVKLRCMTGKDFRRLMDELREFRMRQEEAA